jgi:starvation-inducible DNA-binding protein
MSSHMHTGTGTLSQDHHPTLRHNEREAIGAELQDVLIELLDLALLGKQAHWNIVGPHFRPLHLQLDEYVEAWRLASDAVAERAVALGHNVDGQSRTVAARTQLAPLPEGPIHDGDVVREMSERLVDAIGYIRTRMDRLEDVDAVTADILHGIVAGLEENLWMLRVHAA